MYQEFAHMYDEMMDEIPYEKWFECVRAYLEEQGYGKDSKVCELGCGTGTLTRIFHQAGYDIMGVDLSEEMLMEAREKCPDVMLVQQDITKLRLIEPVDVMIALCDTMNYLTEPESLQQAFHSVRRYLTRDGIFLFDLKTEYCFQQILGDQTRVEEGTDYYSVWENTYFPEEKINQYVLNLFEEKENGLYERSEEVHHQRAYERQEIETMLSQAGLVMKQWLGPELKPYKDDKVERIYVVAARKERENFNEK